jgi:hypothetical protein
MNKIQRYALAILRSPHRQHLFKWLQSTRDAYFLDTPSPWLTFDAISFLKKWLQQHPQPYVFEYGSGGSTLFWLRYGCKCISIEHDKQWFETVTERINRLAVKQIDYRLIEPVRLENVSAPLDPSNPQAYATGDPNWQDYSFRNYVSQIDSYPDGSFDLILVDGRARPSCIVHSIPKVKPGGILIIDNADRDYYFAQIRPLLAPFKQHCFYGVGPRNVAMWQTDLYFR